MSIIISQPSGALPSSVFSDFRDIRGSLLSSLAPYSAQYTYLLLLGDSWMDGSSGINAPTWAEVFQKRLQHAFGSQWAGYGYTNAYRVNGTTYQRGGVIVSQTGGWASLIGSGARGPTLANVTGTTGDTLTFTFTGARAAPVSVVIHYNQVSGAGEFRYRFDGGAWSSTINASGTSASQYVACSGLPSGADFSLEIEIVSGTVSIAGVDHRCGLQGLVVHNLAVSGQTAATYQSYYANSQNWGNGWANSLVLGRASRRFCALWSLGTNDMASATPVSFAASLQALIDNFWTAGSNTYSTLRHCVVCPCENDRDNITPTPDIRVTAYYPVLHGQLLHGDGTVVPVANADDWYGNVDRTAMQAYMNTTGGYHLNELGAGIFAAGVAALFGL